MALPQNNHVSERLQQLLVVEDRMLKIYKKKYKKIYYNKIALTVET